jgi:DNA-binding Xre family transcriptional regulator
MNWQFVRGSLHKILSDKGWSHNLLSEKSGVPQPTISRFLNGESKAMELDTLSDICRALDVGVGEVIGERPITLDDKARRVVRAMESLPEYKKQVVVSTAETLAKPENK